MIHHVELYVSDLQRSKEFWTWLLVDQLGYYISNEWEQGVSIRKNEHYIVLVQTEDDYQEPTYHRKRTGLNHLAFHVDTRASVDDMTEKLKERGVPILYEDKHPYAGGPNYYAVFFEDPDRIKLELVARD